MDRTPGAEEFNKIMEGIAPQLAGKDEAGIWGGAAFKGIIDLLKNLNRRIERLEKKYPQESGE